MKKTLISMGLGAGLMYLLDPKHGEERRAHLCDALSGLLPKTKDALQTKATSISAKADDLAAEAVTTVGTVIEDAGHKIGEKAGEVAKAVHRNGNENSADPASSPT